jgi:type IV secretion system protein VirD4
VVSEPALYRLPQTNGDTAAGIYLGAIVTVVTVIGLAIWAATQYTAYRLGFHPGLGVPLLWVASPYQELMGPAAVVVGAVGAWSAASPRWRPAAAVLLIGTALLLALRVGPLYAPLNFFFWWWRFGNVGGTAPIWRLGMWVVSVPSHLAVFLAIVLAVRRAKRLGGPTDTHGSAHWAQRKDLEAAGLVGQNAGVFIGAWPAGRRLLYLRHAGPQHVLAFAPSRSGKGVGLVLPTLLSWSGSCVVNDIKGENWALTAGWRHQELKSACLKFDPTAAPGSAARYNPLLEVRPWPRDVRDAQLIADMLIDPDGQGTRDHWDLTAHDLLVGVILHTLYAGRDKTLHGCLTLLADPETRIETTLAAMLTAVHDPEATFGWTTSAGQPSPTHPAVAGAARALLNKSDNERSSVVSSAVKFLNLYRDPIVRRNTEASDFAVRDLMHAEIPVSLYLTIPPADIHRTRPLLRLLLHQIVSRLTETMDFAGGRTVVGYRHPLLLMLDELPTLGRMDVLQTALAYLPGYGIQAYLIVQDLTQLAHAYGRYESIISNCHVRVAYAANKVETAKLISDMAGTMTVHKQTRTYTGNRLNPVLMHVMASEQETSRPLLTPDEVMRLPEDAALIFVAGQPPIYGRKIRYYVDRIFTERATVPPPASSDQLTQDWSCWTARLPNADAATAAAETPEAAVPSPEVAAPQEPREVAEAEAPVALPVETTPEHVEPSPDDAAGRSAKPELLL